MLLRGLKMLGILLLSYCNFKFIRKLFTSPSKNMPYIFDKNNRRVLYHGVNLCNASKGAPDFFPWHTKEDFVRLRSWGFNLVRYLVFWQAIEPTKGSYNMGYLQGTAERLHWLKDLGIDVVIDFHQDLYCKNFTGDGFPNWSAVNLPFTERHPWNLNYTEPAVIASYNNFWGSEELQRGYIAALDRLLSFVGSIGNVIGVDIMNEPFQGEIPNFEKKTLTEFYTRIQSMMVEKGHKIRIFFEPTMLTSSGMPTNLDFKPRHGSVYAPHYYDVFCHEGASYTWLNKWLMRKSLKIKIKEAQDFCTPILLGEFYIPSKVKNYLKGIKDIVDLSDEYFTGWTYYAYDKGILINENGTETDTLKSLIEVYPQRIAGKNISIGYSVDSFYLKYEVDPEIKGPTEIFIPRYENVIVTINGRVEKWAYPGTVLKYENDHNSEQTITIGWDF